MQKLKILHIANRLNPGGVERWLVGVAQGLQGSDIQIDLLVHSKDAGELDAKFTETGSRIITCQYAKNPISYAFRLYRALRHNGPYDAVHSHVHHFSGFVLMIAFLARVKMRIAHSHSNRENIEPKTGLRAWYLWLMKRFVKIFANKYVAVSKEAQRSLYADLVADEQINIMYCGIQHLSYIEKNSNYRQEFGIAEDALVLGHIGRLSEPKNHTFLLKIFKALNDVLPATLVIIGDGELKHKIEKQIDEMNLGDQVKMLGMRNDAVDIMVSIFDIIAFPSLYEGLPLTVVEAQASGVPIIVADNITKEAEFDSQFVRYASLMDSPNIWAEKLIDFYTASLGLSRNDSYKKTDFYMPNHLKSLERLYRETSK
jgi:glycosyltransferase involved in cell wall biosynthesis